MGIQSRTLQLNASLYAREQNPELFHKIQEFQLVIIQYKDFLISKVRPDLS
ncbi:hypothetical protein TTHERM_00624520 (macronuclear) [Tetrahymena thermophila SB210]|uniref:Uncharacterized protein n=1 Tax=Tetrahymena thermophila (strain SB210) TaxID=312017 RepID=Q240T1_TETTS|nr:hypothetical protein TTHERM_00624520 [Tetrahymena thermophila SB210]EAS02333.2 hypothetical protein TTHERM_00624520 [Tetrahymena thermophila SB210]|eukprot:XP_001022578.2 hypothetical protein TTHERM_00624520 [Tetrahymena thermophila SB210]